ncbi:RnfABCDGE type electron transport complex subunit G [bacterium]
MREIVKMLVVLTLISSASGLGLGMFKQMTNDPIIQAEFKYAKEPALKEVLPEYDNDLVEDSFEIEMEGGDPVTIYPAKKDGNLVAVGFESKASGFGGPVRIMLGIDTETKALRGIGIVAHAESPGLGAKIIEESFRKQFREGYDVSSVLKVKPDGGKVDALSGATISSRAVCDAINSAFELYTGREAEIVK